MASIEDIMLYKAALVPFQPRLGDLDANFVAHEKEISRIISESNADFICFPELSLSGYLLENLVARCALESHDSKFDNIRKLSKDRVIIVSTILYEDTRFYNACLVFQDQQLVGVQKKIYPPTYGMFYESRYYSAGEHLFSFETKFGRAGILICEDSWHPVLAYALAMQRVTHVFVPSASPNRNFHGADDEAFGSHRNWQKRMQVYAESYGQFYYYVNRSGVEDGILFGGHQFVVAPTGKMTEEQLVYTMNPENMHASRFAGGPYQEEKWTLNHRILSESFKIRTSPPTPLHKWRGEVEN